MTCGETYRTWRARRRSLGLCLFCGKPAEGYALCRACRFRQSEGKRARYRKRKAERAQ